MVDRKLKAQKGKFPQPMRKAFGRGDLLLRGELRGQSYSLRRSC